MPSKDPTPVGQRRAAAARRMYAELVHVITGALPGHEEGMVLVAEFRPGWRWIPRHWPVMGDRVHATTVWAPDNGDHGNCLWARSSPRAAIDAVFSAGQLRRLDRIVRRLDRLGAFYTIPGPRLLPPDAYLWMDIEPDAYPGLERLVLTITPTPSLARAAEEGK